MLVRGLLQIIKGCQISSLPHTENVTIKIVNAIFEQLLRNSKQGNEYLERDATVGLHPPYYLSLFYRSRKG